MIKRKYPLDEAVFFDTGWEFPTMYEHIEKCKNICNKNSIEFVTLHPPYNFDYLMFEHRTKSGKKGYSWCGGNCRWGTRYKISTIDKYSRKNAQSIVYVGIAADETERIKKERDEFKQFPLVEWGITEEQCLKGCYKAGFDWGGMYEHLDRLSCKFCRNKNLKELRNIKKYYPDVWEELKDYQSRTNRPYKSNGNTIFDLEKRFELEDKMLSKGLSITDRSFYKKLKELRGNIDAKHK